MILLARHGNSVDNGPPRRFSGHRDTPLSELGREQARALAEAVADEDLEALWTSPLIRARETAEIVGERLGLVPRIDDRLSESYRGRWEGRWVEELARDEPGGWAAWRRGGADYRFPGGESLAEHQKRALAALDTVRAGPLPALVVCHGGTIRVILAAKSPRGLDAFHEPPEIPNARVIRLDDDGRWTIAA